MNNIQQKNVIYSLFSGTEIPYKNPEYVNHRECCENINEVDVNNLANQLVDNDLYVENFLQHTSSYIVGPKIYDENSISSKVDGYKAFGNIKSSKSLEVLHKVDSPLSSTLQKLQSGSVKFVRKFGDLVIINIDGETKCTYDPINGLWENLRSNGQQVDSTDVFSNEMNCFIAARDGIYQLSVDTHFDETLSTVVEQKQLVKLNSGDDDINATCIAIDKKTSNIYVGTEDDGILVGQINQNSGLIANAGKINLLKKNIWINKKIFHDCINDIEILDNGEVVVAGNQYLYEPEISKNLQNLQTYNVDSGINGNDELVSFNQSIQYNGEIFFGSTSGLWQKGDSNQLEKVQELGNSKIVQMTIGNSKLFIATEDKIFSIDKNLEIKDCQFGSHGTIESIACFEKNVIVATDSGLLQFDASLSQPYVFSLKEGISDVKTICINNDYLVIAGENAISSMLLTQQDNIEMDDIKSLDEVQIVGIDGTGGESGFLKFIEAKGSKIAVFATKLVSLSENKAQISFLDILDAISIETDNLEDFQHIVISTKNGTFIVKYDGSTFTIENQLVADDFQIDKLIQFKSLILGIDYSKNFIFYWSTSNIGDGQLIEWSSLETNSPFNDLKTCGSLCAIGQVLSDGISAFYQSANCLCIGQLDATDACAESELSAQFLCNGRGEISAYVLTATEGDGHIPCFSVSQIGDEQTKNIQIVKFDDSFHMYALNDDGNPYLYKLKEEYGLNQDGDTILTGFSSTLIGNIDNIHMMDIQRFFDSSTQLDGVLFSGEDGISTHFYGYSELENIYSEPISDLAIFKSYNDEDEYEYSLMYPIGHDVIVSSLTLSGDNQILTAFTGDEDLIDKVRVGEFCFFTHNVQNHAILHYEDEEDNQQHQILKIDETAPAQIKDLITFRSSWTNEIDGTAYDILVAAVGNTLHATWFNGKTKTLSPFSQSTTSRFSLTREIINLDFQKSNDDGNENLFKVVATTAKSFHLFDMILDPREDSCPIKIENRINFSLDDLNINIEKALINNDQTVVYMTDDGCVYKKPIYENNNLGAKTLIASDALTIVKSTRINHDKEDDKPDVWCQRTNNVMFSCTSRTPLEAPNEKINSVAQSSLYGIFIGSNDGIHETKKTLDLSNIELNKQISGVKMVSFANGIVFVAGDVGLSCFQYSYPRSSSELSALNNDIAFQGLFANAIGPDDIRLVAWAENKIYSKMYSLNSIDEDSFGELNVDKVYPNVVVDAMINPIDQLKIDVNEEKLNVFMMHFGVENTDDRYVFTNDSKELYWDLDQISLYSYGFDAQTKIHKIIQNDESGDRFDYLSLDKKSIIRYPEGTLIEEFDEPIDDAIKSNGIWYVKKSNQWTYDEKQLPEFDGKTIDVFGILELNGMTYLGSDYGILSATHYKSAVVGENSRYPLTKNVDFEGGFESLNVGKTNSFVLITRESPDLVHAYSFLEKSSTLEEIKFLAPTSAQNPEVQAEIANIWMVNGRYSDGAFCYPKVVEPVEDYMYWLNRIDERVLYPFTNVNEGPINSISHHQDKFYILKAEEIIEFTNYDDEIVFKAIDGSHNTTQNAYSHITPIDSKRALVVGRGGICMYSSRSCSSLKTTYASSLEKYCLDGNFTYAHNDGSDILTSLSYKIWKPLLSLPTTVVPNDIVCINKKTYLFSADDGLYGTKYHYTLVNDVKPIERETVLEIYNDLISSRLSTELDVELENHISTHHASNSFMTSLNRDYATTQLDDIVSSWQKIKVSSDNAMNLGIKNDIIAEIQFGEQNDGDVVVQISNYLDDKDSDTMEEVSGVTYITKRWMSGITEIYINVPTTRTYYLNNLYGASNCNLAPELEISRKNLDDFGVEKMSQNGILSTHYTTLNIGITSAEYSITQLLDVQINGMSLPLKIYQDQSQYGDSRLAGKLYSSFIEPSIVKKYNITTTDEEGNFQFEFACFGTDAQAIHLMFYDEKSRSNSATVKIVFDPNGGEGTMAAQKFIIIYDENGNPVLEKKNLKKNRFTNFSAGYEKIFAGWTLFPRMDNEEATYENMKEFPKSSSWDELCYELNRNPEDFLKHKDEITLYAVWLTYQFSEDDTTLIMDSNKSEFQIAGVGIDESTKLKDKVIINWGD